MQMLKKFLPLVLIALIAISAGAVYATSVSVSTTSYQAQNGVYYVVTGNLAVQGNGFSVAQSSASASSQPAAWSSGGSAHTAITAGHWIYNVTVTLTSSTPANTTYTLTVMWNTGSGYVQMGQIQFTTPSTITSGQSMTFTFDTGTTSFNAPDGIVITVA